MKKRFLLRTAALIAALAVMIPNIFGFSFTSNALTDEGDTYEFDRSVSDDLKREISKRIFEEDFNGICIDLSDLDIPDSEQNRKAVETLLKYGIPFSKIHVVPSMQCGWTYYFNLKKYDDVLECQLKADELLLGIAGNDELTEAEKAYLIHERLLDHCEYYYDYATYDFDGYAVHSYTAYGALMNGYAVCQGYAIAYMYLCRRAGLECYYEDGMSTDKDHIGHAWNVIYLDGADGVRRPYYVDATWADFSGDTERYFLKGYPSFSDTHWNFDPVMYPGAIRDMTPEEYRADDPGAVPPKTTVALSTERYLIVYAASQSGGERVYFGSHKEPRDEDFVYLEPFYKNPHKYIVKTDGPGTYFAAVKDENGTSDVVKIEITEDCYYEGENNTLHITKSDPSAVAHPWSNLSSYNKIVFEDDAKTIPRNSFFSEGFNSVTIPDSVDSIGAYAFCRSAFHDEPYFPESIKTIEEYAFKKCFFSKSYSFCVPDGVETINRGAFIDCIGLNSLTLSKNLKLIKKEAFKGCFNLNMLIYKSVPDSVEEDAFAGCDSLETVFLVSDSGFTLCVPVK